MCSQLEIAVGNYCDTNAFGGFPQGEADAEHEDLFS